MPVRPVEPGSRGIHSGGEVVDYLHVDGFRDSGDGVTAPSRGEQ